MSYVPDQEELNTVLGEIRRLSLSHDYIEALLEYIGLKDEVSVFDSAIECSPFEGGVDSEEFIWRLLTLPLETQWLVARRLLNKGR